MRGSKKGKEENGREKGKLGKKVITKLPYKKCRLTNSLTGNLGILEDTQRGIKKNRHFLKTKSNLDYRQSPSQIVDYTFQDSDNLKSFGISIRYMLMILCLITLDIIRSQKVNCNADQL